MARKNTAFMRPVLLTPELEAVVGNGPMPRTEVTRKLWDYIKENGLQDTTNKRNINPDDKLAKVFGSYDSINMFEMARVVAQHLSEQTELAGV